jgi:hypothetical protein
MCIPACSTRNQQLGLMEISAVRATRDSNEVGDFNPNVQLARGRESGQRADSRNSQQRRLARADGPQRRADLGQVGGDAIGRLDLGRHDGEGRGGMHVDWPTMSPVSNWRTDESAKAQAERRDQVLKRLDEIFDNARAYRTARQADESRQPKDVRWEAMLPVLEGEQPLIVSAEEVQQIQAAVAFAVRQKVKLIIYGGYDAELCAELLTRHDVPVILAGVYRDAAEKGVGGLPILGQQRMI